MEVRFDDKKLEKLCTDEKTMRKKRGDIAPRLRTRINALRTATRVGDLATLDPLGRWHPLTANLAGLWAGKLSGNFRLPIRPEGSGDHDSAVTVTVIDIGDYH